MRAVRLTAQGATGHRVGAHPEQVEEVLLGDRRTLLDPPAIVEGGEASAEEDTRRGSRLGVVAGQARRRSDGSVTGRDRLHQVAIARPQGHPS